MSMNKTKSYIIVYNAPCSSTDGRIVYVSETCMVANRVTREFKSGISSALSLFVSMMERKMW